jgi:hypothetical protein
LVLLAWLALGFPLLAIANGAYAGGVQAMLPLMVYLLCAIAATFINLILFFSERLRHQRFAIIGTLLLWLPVTLGVLGELIVEIASRFK